MIIASVGRSFERNGIQQIRRFCLARKGFPGFLTRIVRATVDLLNDTGTDPP